MENRDHSDKSRDMGQLIGAQLRFGVVLAAAICTFGGMLFFIQHPDSSLDFGSFSAEPKRLRDFNSILHEAFELRSRAVIQLGILVLMATPVLRVLLSFFGFVKERDWLYAIITLLVIAILFFSLAS